jgi:TRAP-type C4-dicarboxylate transport system substrate-binding protein
MNARFLYPGLIGVVLLGIVTLPVGLKDSDAEAAAAAINLKYNEAKWGKLPDKAVTNKNAKIVLVTATIHPAPHYEDMAMRFFHKRLEDLTNSRMSTNYYAGGVLTKDSRELMDMNIKGDVDFTRLDESLGAISPVFELGGGVFLFDSPEHMYRIMDGKEFIEKTQKDLERNNLVILGTFGMARQLYTRKSVRSLNDLKGMKIRTMEIPSVMHAWNALGASATPLSFGEFFTSLQTGLVDGGEGSATAYYSSKFQEVAKYIAVINYKYGYVSYAMNKKKLDSLPSDLQKAVVQAGKEAVELTREICVDWDTDVYEKLKASGVTVVTQKEIPDFPVWRQRIREARVNAELFKRAGTEFERLVEEARR